MLDESDRRNESIHSRVEKARKAALEDDYDYSAIRDSINDLKRLLIEAGGSDFDSAKKVSALGTDGTVRGLGGKEPIGYSTPDGGGKHDAYYGSAALNRGFARRVRWPLDLGNWDREQAEQSRSGIGTVTATGTTKYTKKIGGRVVHVVVDARGLDPF